MGQDRDEFGRSSHQSGRSRWDDGRHDRDSDNIDRREKRYRQDYDNQDRGHGGRYRKQGRFENDRGRLDDHSRRDHPPNNHGRPHRGPNAPVNQVLDRGAIVRGTVSRMEPYGAFLDFTVGTQQNRGLIHISELDQGRVEKVEDVLQMHQNVCAVVLSADGRRVRLSLVGVNQKTGQLEIDINARENNRNSRGGGGGGDRGGGGRGGDNRMSQNQIQRAERRAELCRRTQVAWRSACPNDGKSMLLWGRSPSPPPAADRKAASSKKDDDDDDDDDSGSESESESDSDESDSESDSDSDESTDSEEERRRRRRQKKKSGSRGRSSSKSRSRRRRRSPSTSSDSSSSSSSDSDSDDSGSEEEKETTSTSVEKTTENDTTVLDDQDLRDARDFKKAVQGDNNDDDDDDDDYAGPMPLPQSNATDGGNTGGRGKYGEALLPGEGQAIAAYVQQNLRIPRRGEIGYSGDQIDQFETSGYVMSGSRHARMNAVRLRKENQVYSAEEQRALALITMEENQQKEAQLMQDFRTMLKEKERVRKGGK